jgi:murein DD-endopeptidase MepM/ murein hydrolase activator NlpD
MFAFFRRPALACAAHLAAMVLAICGTLFSPAGRAHDAGDFAGVVSDGSAARAKPPPGVSFVPEFRDLFMRWRAHDALRPAPVVVRVLTEKAWVQAEARYAIRRRLPVATQQVTSGFGWRTHPILGGWRHHSGTDLAAPLGAPILAPTEGVCSPSAPMAHI